MLVDIQIVTIKNKSILFVHNGTSTHYYIILYLFYVHFNSILVMQVVLYKLIFMHVKKLAIPLNLQFWTYNCINGNICKPNKFMNISCSVFYYVCRGTMFLSTDFGELQAYKFFDTCKYPLILHYLTTFFHQKTIKLEE